MTDGNMMTAVVGGRRRRRERRSVGGELGAREGGLLLSLSLGRVYISPLDFGFSEGKLVNLAPFLVWAL